MGDETKKPLNRRKFVGNTLWGTFLLTVGGTAGWFASKRKARNLPPDLFDQPDLDVYDLSAYERIDPDHILYRQSRQFPVELSRVQRLEHDGNGRILVAGGKTVAVFAVDGTALDRIEMTAPIHCLHALQDGRLVVGMKDRFSLLDGDGQILHTSEPLGQQSFLTAITSLGDDLFVADAGQREVMRCDLQGRVRAFFGKRSRYDNPGFTVPSPYFDLATDPAGFLFIVNPGQLRVERFDPDGRFLGAWGGPGMNIDQFCGCCNPVYIHRMADGRLITSEKGLTRINLYDQEGNYLGTVAGGDQLIQDRSPVKRLGFDIVSDREKRIYALDPYQHRVRVFEPIRQEAPA